MLSRPLKNEDFGKEVWVKGHILHILSKAFVVVNMSGTSIKVPTDSIYFPDEKPLTNDPKWIKEHAEELREYFNLNKDKDGQ